MKTSDQRICGRIVSGEGRGRHFTRLDWARRQFIDKLGIDPYPGTVNLIVADADSKSVWDRLKDTPGVRISNPNEDIQDCSARCYRVSIGGHVDGAVVFPEVAEYAEDQVEIIAALGVRNALGTSDGDSLTLEIQ